MEIIGITPYGKNLYNEPISTKIILFAEWQEDVQLVGWPTEFDEESTYWFDPDGSPNYVYSWAYDVLTINGREIPHTLTCISKELDLYTIIAHTD